MPVTIIGSYAPTMQQFINHWTQVNASLGANPLTLRGVYTLALFTNDRAGIIAAINAVIAADNTAATTSGNLSNLKIALRLRIIQFRKWVSGYLPGSPYILALPNTPGISAVESRFLDPLQDMLGLWNTINTDAALTGIPLPATLAGDYDVDTFTDDLTNLRAAFIAAKNAQEQAKFVRKQRDVLFKPAEQRMKQYREVILGRFDAASPFAQSLPALSPSPGSTPDPVVANGVWNAATKKATLTWAASTATNLERYSVRACVGRVYRTVNESVIAEVASDKQTYSTDFGLLALDSTVIFRVYVVTNNGNERGSNDVPIVHTL